MMQGFYWDCPTDWYRVMEDKAEELRNMQDGYGIDRMWFPPPQKSHSGRRSMGYDPYDYFDLGQYDQKGTVPTHFGTHGELRNVIKTYRRLGISSMADIVLNHRSGGGSESNPNLDGAKTWTDFRGVASGRATWRYDQFHPTAHHKADTGVFADFADVCHVSVAGQDLIEWGNWLIDPDNAGFDGGWRLDYVKGVNPSYLGEFLEGTGRAYGILECWDGIPLIEEYLEASDHAAAFDFPAFYTMGKVFNHGADIDQLIDPDEVFAARNPERAVTFVANHDTDKDTHVESITNNTMLAYAFILTYQGYPCIFWKDYFDYGLSDLGGQDGNGIIPLVRARGALAGGEPDIEIIKAVNPDLLVYGTSEGSADHPGYIVAINNHSSKARTVKIKTGNRFLHRKTLQCHAWYSYIEEHNAKPADTGCDYAGKVTLTVPPRGYAVYSVER
jgi:alpha-amylase